MSNDQAQGRIPRSKRGKIEHKKSVAYFSAYSTPNYGTSGMIRRLEREKRKDAPRFIGTIDLTKKSRK